ncbi:MAG: Ig-like domain-containing protein [Paracoccaceae bacterium]|nr:Ig-like domain-containing protein [Paracoccaceae bacterium]
MVKSVDFAVRNVMGGVSRGVVSGEGASEFIQVGSGDEISLNLRKTNILKYVREGDDLQIVLVDGRTITLSGYYDAIPGEENKLYISSDGEITAVTLEDGGDGVMFAQYDQPELIGKWSPNDQLAFMNGEDLIAPVAADDTTGMAAFAPLLLGGIGSGGLVAAGVAGAAIIGGGSGGGGGGGDVIVPTVDDPDADSTLTTNTANPAAVVTGTGEAGSTVVVELGDQTLETTVGEDGTWGVSFEGDSFPSDGDLTSTVTVTAPDGTVTDLDGPDFLIDMTPPDVAVTAGADSTGDVENLAEYQNGISVSGTGEAGAAITVEVAGHTQSTVVGANGSWTVTFPTSDLPAGTYTEAMTITATDVNGNTTTITDTMVVDTEITLTQTMVPGGADGVVSGAEIPAGVMIGGAVDAGSSVIVTLANGQTITATVTDGSWTAAIPTTGMTGEGSLGYTVVATDPNGNVSDPLVGSVTYDTVLNTLTTGTSTNTTVVNDAYVNKAEGAAGVVLSGTVEAGSTSVTVTLADGSTVHGAISGTTWTATIPASYATGEGTLTYTVNAVDAYGNTRVTPVSGAVMYDTLVNQFTLNGTTGGADGVVNKAESTHVTVGGTVEAGSSVVLTLADGSKVTAMVSGTTWTATLPASQMSGEGTLSYTAQATDARGNVSAALAGSVAYDTVLTDLTHGTTTNTTVVNDAYVNKAEGAAGVVLTGTVEAGAQSVTVTLADGSTINGTVSGASWTATIPASYATGEGTLTYTVNAVDAHDNTLSTPLAGAVQYDTIVRDFTQAANVTTDGMLNATEAAAGFSISGTVEPNSDIVVRLESGATRAVHVGADGTWSVDFSATDLAGANGTMHYTVTATDHAGNVAVLGDDSSLSFGVDLVAPEAPEIEAVTLTTNTDNVRAIYTDADGEGTYAIHAVAANGDVSPISLSTGEPIALGGEDLYNFSSSVPNGSYLVVTDTDLAGNEASTLLVVDNNSAVSIDLGRGGLAEFDFGAIDLSFAEADLTITAQQIQAMTGPDNALIIQGDAADHVTAIGAQDTGLDQTISGKTYSVYTLGDDGASLIIDDHITHLTI